MEALFLCLTSLSLVIALVLMVILFVIDFKHYLLPDRYVFPLGILGVLFHTSLHFTLLPVSHLGFGAIVGGGLLWVVRWGGTKYYKQEAMGLGDVKLMLVAGLWLGPEHIVTAIMVGATAGLIHGLIVAGILATKTGSFSINRLIIPAGPGFIVGIVVVFAWVFGLDILLSFTPVLSIIKVV